MLLTTLGICATFFSILILCVHGTMIGVQTWKAHNQKKQLDKANFKQLIADCVAGDKEALKSLLTKIDQK